MPTPRIDAHHHLWNYVPEDFPWISAEMPALQRDFGIAELAPLLAQSEIDGTIAVQARQSLAETEFLLAQAAVNPLIRGVVGWVPLTDPNVEAAIERYAENRALRGVRHILHDESNDDYMLRDDFNRGVSLLARYGMRYDVLIFDRHLPQAIAFVDRHPQQVFVVDHVAKPRIREGEMEPWRGRIRELARRENVSCKLSGMATEADWQSWTEAGLKPYFDVVLEAFGPKRLMFGSDWPVLGLASSYERWFATVQRWLDPLSLGEREAILGGTAAAVYGL